MLKNFIKFVFLFFSPERETLNRCRGHLPNLFTAIVPHPWCYVPVFLLCSFNPSLRPGSLNQLTFFHLFFSLSFSQLFSIFRLYIIVFGFSPKLFFERSSHTLHLAAPPSPSSSSSQGLIYGMFIIRGFIFLITYASSPYDKTLFIS